MDRNLALEAVRVTEAAALASARLMGRGDIDATDRAGAEAMLRTFQSIGINGVIVIGDSGGSGVFIHPGVVFSIAPTLQMFGLVSLPMSQQWNSVVDRQRFRRRDHEGLAGKRHQRPQQHCRVQAGRYRCSLPHHFAFEPCSNSVTKATRWKPADDSRPITRIMVP